MRILVGGREPTAPPPEAPGTAPALPGSAAPPAPPAPEEPVERTYEVAAGDTLGEIALATLGTSRKAAELAAHNGMKPSTPLRVGQVLRIPPPAPPAPPPPPSSADPRGPSAGPPGGSAGAPPPSRAPASGAPAASSPPAKEKPAARTHRVGRGETLYALAKRYYGSGGRWRTIADANGLSEGDALPVGTTLRIP